jgi:2-polyprenyl-3-methyl-5-hydroxy-6-metoxy-1,4-benzoquinol methylase
MLSSTIDGSAYPRLARLAGAQAAETPAYARFIESRFSNAAADELALCEDLSGKILALAGSEISEFHRGFGFICEIQKEEEYYFRRHGRYRLNTFEEAYREVYSNKAYMNDYMNGLLMTQVFWSNHTSCIGYYKNSYLKSQGEQYDYLEIGPGHGLLLCEAASDPRCKSVTGWDVSEASIAQTRRALSQLHVARDVKLTLQDLFDAAGHEGQFDAVTFSEVLEHLEKPAEALQSLRRILKPGGTLLVNVPVNSPAPDHLYLLRSPEEAVEAVAKAGFEIVDTAFFPVTNCSLADARKRKLTISVCVVGRRRGH